MCARRAAEGAPSGTDRPRIAAVDRVRAAVRNGGSVRPAIPLNHGAFPRNAVQLKELGVGYTNCAPTPEALLLKSLSPRAFRGFIQPGRSTVRPDGLIRAVADLASRQTDRGVGRRSEKRHPLPGSGGINTCPRCRPREAYHFGWTDV